MNQIVRISKIVIVAALILWIVPRFFLQRVEPDMIGIRQSNLSGVLAEDLAPGWHWRIPGIHKITDLPRRYIFLDYTDDSVGPQSPLEIRTTDNNIVHLDVSVPVKILKGQGYKIVMDGNHTRDTDGRFRYIRLAQAVTISVLRDQLAKLSSAHFYSTDLRLKQAEITKQALNKSLSDLHLEAQGVLIRAVRYRREFEQQLQQMQLNTQLTQLDAVREEVAIQQKSLDSYVQGTRAKSALLKQEWIANQAELERFYQVGFVANEGNMGVDSLTEQLKKISKEKRDLLDKQVIKSLGWEADTEVGDQYLLGIKNIRAATLEYRLRVNAQSDAISARLTAEGEAKIAKIRGAFEGKVNALLGTPAGSAFVAWKSAAYVKFSDELVFHSGDGIPAILKLRDFAKAFMGNR